jgi:hypothetical protein
VLAGTGRGDGGPEGSAQLYLARTFRAVGGDAPSQLGTPRQLRLDGIPFAQGHDGFVYDFMGRPHLATPEGKLSPLSQLGFFLLARRLAQRPDPLAALEELTAPTRALFATLARSGEARAAHGAVSDVAVLADDNAYRASLPRGARAELLPLFDLAGLDDQALFSCATAMTATTPASFALSRHLQLDLELWHLQRALEDDGDHAHAATVRSYRDALFTRAKAFVEGAGDPDRASPENPLGFEYAYEALAHAHSPLRFSSLAEAIAAEGDEHLVAWRGDTVLVTWTGIHPDNVRGREDARDLAARRAAKGGTHGLFQDLAQAATSPVGSGYQPFTSDLALLAKSHSFADKVETGSVRFSTLPAAIARPLRARLGNDGELHLDTLRDAVGVAMGRRALAPGEVEVSGVSLEALDEALGLCAAKGEPAEALAAARARLAPKVARLPPLQRLWSAMTDAPVRVELADVLSAEGVQTLRNELSKLRDVVTLRMHPDDPERLEVTTYRRAFRARLDKRDCLPGASSLGGPYLFEQEVTSLSRVPRRELQAVYTQAELARAL